MALMSVYLAQYPVPLGNSQPALGSLLITPCMLNLSVWFTIFTQKQRPQPRGDDEYTGVIQRLLSRH